MTACHEPVKCTKCNRTIDHDQLLLAVIQAKPVCFSCMFDIDSPDPTPTVEVSSLGKREPTKTAL